MFAFFLVFLGFLGYLGRLDFLVYFYLSILSICPFHDFSLLYRSIPDFFPMQSRCNPDAIPVHSRRQIAFIVGFNPTVIDKIFVVSLCRCCRSSNFCRGTLALLTLSFILLFISRLHPLCTIKRVPKCQSIKTTQRHFIFSSFLKSAVSGYGFGRVTTNQQPRKNQGTTNGYQQGTSRK